MKKNSEVDCVLLLVALGSCTLHLQAKELGFRRYFSDGMVLEREKPIRVSSFVVEGGR